MSEFDFEEATQESKQKGDETYDELDLRPGGLGKQGDQQQMGQRDREIRRDKSHNDPDSDKEHLP